MSMMDDKKSKFKRKLVMKLGNFEEEAGHQTGDVWPGKRNNQFCLGHGFHIHAGGFCITTAPVQSKNVRMEK